MRCLKNKEKEQENIILAEVLLGKERAVRLYKLLKYKRKP